MEQIRPEELRRFAPHAEDYYINALVQGWGELERGGINTALRVCHFLAQTAHETGGYTIVREWTTWTPDQMCRLWPSRFKTKLDPRIRSCKGDPRLLANLAYSGRADIGNQGGDDGWDYRGGGFLQLTGREAYARAGAAIGVDLEGNPEAIEDPAVSLRVAVWEWAQHGCNAFADHNYGRAVGNAINRGNPYSKYEPIGAEQRAQWFARAWQLFGQGELPDDADLFLGAYGPKVKRVQQQLKELGYAVGDADGVLGPTLARAIAGFKLDHKRNYGVDLEPDEVVGELTLIALDQAEPIRIGLERQQATVADMIDRGSTEVVAGQRAQAAGKAALIVGSAEAARQAGAFDQATELLSQVGSTKTLLVPVVDALSWGLRNAFPVLVIVGGVWFWTKGRHIIAARLEAHRSGSNLSK